jgi:hypothetical protein
MRDLWSGSFDLDPAERTGPWPEADRGLPGPDDMAEHNWTAPRPDCLCGCGPDSTHHARRIA